MDLNRRAAVFGEHPAYAVHAKHAPYTQKLTMGKSSVTNHPGQLGPPAPTGGFFGASDSLSPSACRIGRTYSNLSCRICKHLPYFN